MAQPFDMLDEADRNAVMNAVVGSAGTEGMHEDEVVRQVGIISEWWFKNVVNATIMDMARDGKVFIRVNDKGEPDIMLNPSF